jgi:hypothetical protein
MTITASPTNEMTAESSILIRDAGERGDLGRNRFGRFVERCVDIPEARDATVRQVIELDHSKFDDLILLLIETGCLDVEQDAGFGVLTDGRREYLPRNQTPEDTVVGRFGQRLRHGGQSWIVFKHWTGAIPRMLRQHMGLAKPQV